MRLVADVGHRPPLPTKTKAPHGEALVKAEPAPEDLGGKWGRHIVNLSGRVAFLAAAAALPRPFSRTIAAVKRRSAGWATRRSKGIWAGARTYRARFSIVHS